MLALGVRSLFERYLLATSKLFGWLLGGCSLAGQPLLLKKRERVW